VPCQTALSLFLAVLVNRQILRGRGFFRTAFYFPSVTSSVAITVLFLFLFSTTGRSTQRSDGSGSTARTGSTIRPGSCTSAPPADAALTQNSFLGVSFWDWMAGPASRCASTSSWRIFTTSGTFMLLFLAALQNISGEVQEAAMMDGANGWQRFWRITLPQLRPTLFTVLTLGLIGCWQVFDQIYTGTRASPPRRR
jgi:multiple sugar transport system permease protein